jgi:DNA replication protein DnaC
MNTETTLDQLKKLKLQGMTRSYEALLSLPLHQQPEAHELIGQLAQSEIDARQQRRTDLFLKLGKLRYAATLDQIKCSPERNLSKEQISRLADCSFINKAENILISGATGCGKSFLACAIGYQTCLMGYKTMYLNMNRFIEKITMAKLDGTWIKALNHMEKIRLLIIDDFGLQPLTSDVRLALLQILEDRYDKHSILIASQLPVAKWYEYLQDATLADAILDRLTAHAHRLELKGKSMRKNK